MEGGIPTTGMLDLEEMPSLHHHQQRQQQQQQLFPFAHEFNNSSPLQQQQLTNAAYGIGGGSNGSRGKQHPLVLGSEDEHAFADHAAAADAGTKRTAQQSSAAAASPWQRMKWTDGMVRLLIMVVYCIGDDGTGTEAADQHQQQQPSTGKGKKPQAAAAAAGLLLQKKGKWKSVSRAMMEKGFYVSPQQCEDKFNDLNKRYKRVNDLLGKGTACRVVENQSLLDTMDHLSPKAKEEARKLLNSKHLFFREMCAYHNSGGGAGGGGGTAASCSSSLALSQPLLPSQQALHEPQQQCSHHQLNSSHRFTGKRGHEDNIEDEDDMHDDRDEDADNDDDADDDYDDEDDYDDDILSHDKKQHNHQQQQQQQRGSKDEDDKEFKAAKKARTSLLMSASSMSPSPPLSLSLSASPAAAAAAAATSSSMQQLKCEMLESLAAIVGEQQQRHWLRKKAAELEEQRLGYQCQALELKRQRFKWLRFSSNKEHEMKRMKLHNERRCLENDRMLLLLHQKEHEITNANCNPSSMPAKFAADHFNCA